MSLGAARRVGDGAARATGRVGLLRARLLDGRRRARGHAILNRFELTSRSGSQKDPAALIERSCVRTTRDEG